MVYPVLARHFIRPLGEVVLRTNIMKYLDQLEEIQWWSLEQLRQLQDRKLRAVIKHSHENVPYYHRISQERGLTYRDIQSIDNLPKLPILTKDLLRQHFDELLAENCTRWQPLLNEWEDTTEVIVRNVLEAVHRDSPARTSSDTV